MFGIIILLFSLIFINPSCTKFDEDEGVVPVAELPDQESWGNQIYFTREGQRRAVLTAGYIAKYHKKRYTLLKEGVKVNFYGETGEQTSVLTSDEGKVFDNKQDMVAFGNVVVKSKNGTILYSEELYWKNKAGKIVSEVPVKITTDTDIIYGDTFKSDPDLVDYEITNAHGTSEQTISIDDQ